MNLTGWRFNGDGAFMAARIIISSHSSGGGACLYFLMLLLALISLSRGVMAKNHTVSFRASPLL
jgi:hypothetical protein